MSLSDLSTSEWEALCDGCAKCCLLVVDGVRTPVACPFLDIANRQCLVYGRRHEVPWCGPVTPDNLGEWLPDTCAYRRYPDKPLAPGELIAKSSLGLVHLYGDEIA